MNNKLRSKRIYCTHFMLMLFLVFLCRSGLASIDSTASENVKLEGDRISVQAKGTKLGELVKEIKKKTGIKFELSETLLETKITVGFKGLPLLEGIKKIIYPLDYAIVYDPGNVISKVIVVGKNNESTMMAYNEKIDEFYSDSQDLSSPETTFTEGYSGTDVFVPAPPEPELIEGPPGTDILIDAPPEPELIEGPPGTDILIDAPPEPEANEDFPENDVFEALEIQSDDTGCSTCPE